jgi:hypothetical protein
MLDVYSGRIYSRARVQLDQEFIDGNIRVVFKKLPNA